MSDRDYRKGGLRHKYHVTKTSGEEVDSNAAYFVLRLDADPHARAAALAYADSVERTNPTFAEDIRAWVKDPVPIENYANHVQPPIESLSFEDGLARLINYHSLESRSATPDFILARFLVKALHAYDEALIDRTDWFAPADPDDEASTDG